MSPKPPTAFGRAMRLVIPVGLLVLLVASLRHIDTVAGWLVWMSDQGPLGHAVFVGFYVAGTLLMVPASILEGASGFLYGAILGVVVAAGLGTASATLSFLLGRTLFRRAVERRIADDARLTAIDQAVSVDGARLVFLLRLSPLSPFNLMSLFLGATPVRTRDFVLGTLLGHLFPVVVFAYTGSTVASALDLVDGAAPPGWATAIGLALTVVATIGVTRFAKRTLDSTLAPAS